MNSFECCQNGNGFGNVYGCGQKGFKCGDCVLKELEPPPPRVIKNPNKEGVCNCLNDPANGFKYTAHELVDGKIVDVQYIKCDNTKYKLVDLTKVKKDKRETLKIVETTHIKNLVWIEWCKTQCVGKCKR